MSARRDHNRTAAARSPRVWIGLAVALVAVAAVFSATAVVTDRPDFCPTCHEMRPYYTAWQAGGHRDVWCIDCHVGKGLPRRFAHKFVALGEVWAHATGEYAFPMPAPTAVPNERCAACHRSVSPKEVPPTFDHDRHADDRPCQLCHEDAGHRVTNADLRQAGVFSPGNAEARARSASRPGAVATPGRGVANLKGHVPVGCSKCHDMAKTGCPACHQAPARHKYGGDCSGCHRPGRSFAFSHPRTGDCRECHKAPQTAEHPLNDDCNQCHRQGGKSWAFTHPKSADCAQCHRLPGGKHPASANCTACHQKPGRSWAFRHPSGNTGEHTYRSFPCAKCHPQSFDRVSCTCHKNGVPTD